jgi:predicted RNase H-like nuclease (RuvC/YqgF family)
MLHDDISIEEHQKLLEKLDRYKRINTMLAKQNRQLEYQVRTAKKTRRSNTELFEENKRLRTLLEHAIHELSVPKRWGKKLSTAEWIELLKND